MYFHCHVEGREMYHWNETVDVNTTPNVTLNATLNATLNSTSNTTNATRELSFVVAQLVRVEVLASLAFLFFCMVAVLDFIHRKHETRGVIECVEMTPLV